MAAFGFYTRCVHGVEKQNKYLKRKVGQEIHLTAISLDENEEPSLNTHLRSFSPLKNTFSYC